MNKQTCNNVRTSLVNLAITNPNWGLRMDEGHGDSDACYIIVSTTECREHGDLPSWQLVKFWGISLGAGCDISVQLNSERDGLELLYV